MDDSDSPSMMRYGISTTIGFITAYMPVVSKLHFTEQC